MMQMIVMQIVVIINMMMVGGSKVGISTATQIGTLKTTCMWWMISVHANVHHIDNENRTKFEFFYSLCFFFLISLQFM